jgi:chromosome segregation ATPase
MRAPLCLLAAAACAFRLAGCKSSDDKPRPPDPPAAEPARDKASEAVEKAKEQVDTAADKARSALDAVKEKAAAAGDRAAGALTDAKTVRDMLSLMDGRIAKATDELQRASTDDARRSATAALEQLKQQKRQLEARLAVLLETAPSPP